MRVLYLFSTLCSTSRIYILLRCTQILPGACSGFFRRAKPDRRITNIVKNESYQSDKVAEVIQFVRQSGGLEYAREAMYRYRQEAFDILYAVP